MNYCRPSQFHRNEYYNVWTECNGCAPTPRYKQQCIPLACLVHTLFLPSSFRFVLFLWCFCVYGFFSSLILPLRIDIINFYTACVLELCQPTGFHYDHKLWIFFSLSLSGFGHKLVSTANGMLFFSLVVVVVSFTDFNIHFICQLAYSQNWSQICSEFNWNGQ